MKKPEPNPPTITTIRKPSSLRFTPTAWAKLLCLRDAGPTEIGGFGIAVPDDLLLVEDVGLVDQVCSPVHVEFDDQSVADYFDAQIDAGRRPHQFARIWIHTHPGSSPQPSATDEATFARVFGGADWALMFILARGGQTYARLRYNVGPGSDLLVPVEIDFTCPFAGSDAPGWHHEYEAHVRNPPPEPVKAAAKSRRTTRLFDVEPIEELRTPEPPGDWYEDWYDYTRYDDTPRETDYGYVRDF